MKIAYIVGAFPNPSETFIAREIAALEARGVEAEVFPIWRAAGGDADMEGGPPVHWFGRLPLWPAFRHPLAAGLWKWWLLAHVPWEGCSAVRATWRLGNAFAIAQTVRGLGIGRVHAQFANMPSTVGWIAASVARVPFSFAVHARDVFVEAQFLRQKARAADHIVACNSAVAKRTAELVDEADREKIELIHHGLPLADYPFRDGPPEGAEPPLVLGVGRLVEKKGFVHLVRAMARLRERGVAARCWLVGDGHERRALRREIEALGVGDMVELMGWMTPGELKMTAYEQASVLAVPSVVARDGDMDGLPNVVLEAAAIGLPIVSTTVGGIGDLVRDGDTALVARPADPADLADKLQAGLSGHDAAMQRALEARAKVEAGFDARKQVDKLASALGLAQDA